MLSLVRAIAALLVIGSLATVPAPACAAQLVNQVLQEFIKKWATDQLQGAMKEGFDKVTKTSNDGFASVQAEINKQGAIAGNVAVATADAQQIAAFRKHAYAIDASTEIGSTTCAAVGTGAGLAVASMAGRQRLHEQGLMAAAGKSLASTNGNYNTATRLASAYREASRRYCTEVDQERGRCSKQDADQVAAMPHLRGADVSPELMFGVGPDGATSWATTSNEVDSSYQASEQAIDRYISCVVAATPPEVLRNPSWERVPAGKAYVELTRRYDAFMAMSRYSLGSIKESNRPVAGVR